VGRLLLARDVGAQAEGQHRQIWHRDLHGRMGGRMDLNNSGCCFTAEDSRIHQNLLATLLWRCWTTGLVDRHGGFIPHFEHQLSIRSLSWLSLALRSFPVMCWSNNGQEPPGAAE
jgi:hypothetical protein